MILVGYLIISGGCSLVFKNGQSNDAGADEDSGFSIADAQSCSFIEINEDFSEPTINPTRWLVRGPGGSAIVNESKMLELIPAHNIFLESVLRHDLSDARVSIEVGGMVDTSKIARAHLAFGNGSSFITLYQMGGLMRFGLNDNVDDSEVIDVAVDVYEPSVHRFWQLREENGIVYAEVASAESDWKELGRVELTDTSNFRIDSGVVWLWADMLPTETNPGSFIIDNVNNDSRCR